MQGRILQLKRFRIEVALANYEGFNLRDSSTFHHQFVFHNPHVTTVLTPDIGTTNRRNLQIITI